MSKKKEPAREAPEAPPLPAKPRVTLTTREGGITIIGSDSAHSEETGNAEHERSHPREG